jgi:hypothetical protein
MQVQTICAPLYDVHCRSGNSPIAWNGRIVVMLSVCRTDGNASCGFNTARVWAERCEQDRITDGRSTSVRNRCEMEQPFCCFGPYSQAAINNVKYNHNILLLKTIIIYSKTCQVDHLHKMTTCRCWPNISVTGEIPFTLHIRLPL